MWTDPTRMHLAVVVVVDVALEELPGVDAAAVEAAAADYQEQLASMEASMEERFEQVPEEDRLLVTNHHVFSYFAERFGFEIVGAVLPSGTTLASPSASDLDDLADVLRETGVPAIFSLIPGETVALVGASGAGKSTTAHRLMRFWDPTSGRITIGGHDIRDLPLAQLWNLITFVPQDTYLFHATLRDNLRLGRTDATDDDLVAVTAASCADEIIDSLPDGLDTIVGERGATLSGGQRQRIALARALLRDNPILVMDEPVSNLDTETERELAAAMATIRAERTVLIIAHRLSTIRTADRVLVLDNGRLVEAGTHQRLLADNGVYRNLVESQLGC